MLLIATNLGSDEDREPQEGDYRVVKAEGHLENDGGMARLHDFRNGRSQLAGLQPISGQLLANQVRCSISPANKFTKSVFIEQQKEANALRLCLFGVLLISRSRTEVPLCAHLLVDPHNHHQKQKDFYFSSLVYYSAGLTLSN